MTKDPTIHVPPFVGMILKKLRDKGHAAFVVGGAVRDVCMGRPAADWDVATSASSEEIRTLFRDLRHFSLKHDTVTLVAGGRRYEVTPFRGSRGDILGDLSHRDFTINAMAYDVFSRRILDPSGGRRDLSRQLVRAAGRPEDRFNEDPLRILRAVRLASELGFRIGPRTMRAMVRLRETLNSTAPERIRDEWVRILMAHKPSVGLRLMIRTGLLDIIIPELSEALGRWRVSKQMLKGIDLVRADPAARMAGFFSFFAVPWPAKDWGEEGKSLVRGVLMRFRASNELRDRVTRLLRCHMRLMDFEGGWSEGAVRRFVRLAGPEHMGNLISLFRARRLAQDKKGGKPLLPAGLEREIRRIMNGRTVMSVHDLAIDGRRVIETLNIPPGPAIGEILRRLMEEVTDHPELNTEEGLVGVLREGWIAR